LQLRNSNVFAMISMICCFSSFSVIYFIYTEPGKANAYLYRLEQLRDVFLAGGNWRQNNYYSSDMVYDIHDPEFDFPENYTSTYSQNNVCPEKFPEMDGRINVNLTEISLETINNQILDKYDVTMGGSWQPDDCVAKYKVAILVPFRNRHAHLPIFLRHIYPMMAQQHLNFTIFVIEQRGELPFNRAMLFNAGFELITANYGAYDCMIFHDVDHIPENNRNYYGCSNMPRHFAEELDIHNYKLEYPEFFGGVTGVTWDQYKLVNGYSNMFWGWGGEDDDFHTRITSSEEGNFTVSRPPNHYGRYSSITQKHNQEGQFLGRFQLMKQRLVLERMFLEGLSTVNYKEEVLTKEKLYTNISLVLSKEGQLLSHPWYKQPQSL